MGRAACICFLNKAVWMSDPLVGAPPEAGAAQPSALWQHKQDGKTTTHRAVPRWPAMGCASSMR